MIDRMFSLGVEPLQDVRAMPRAVANELAVAGTLAPLAVSDLSAPVSPVVSALDASPWKGARVEAPLSASTVRALWRHGNSRGGYSSLEGAPTCASAIYRRPAGCR